MKIKCNSYLVCKFDKANSIDITDQLAYIYITEDSQLNARNYICVKLGEEYLADFKSLFYFSDITKLKLKETKIKFWRFRFYIHAI